MMSQLQRLDHLHFQELAKAKQIQDAWQSPSLFLQGFAFEELCLVPQTEQGIGVLCLSPGLNPFHQDRLRVLRARRMLDLALTQ